MPVSTPCQPVTVELTNARSALSAPDWNRVWNDVALLRYRKTAYTGHSRRTRNSGGPRRWPVTGLLTIHRAMLCQASSAERSRLYKWCTQVATQVSEDRATAKEGGKLPGLIRRNNHPFGREFDAAFNADPGLFNRVVETPAGYHVILVEKRHPARVVPLVEVREALRRELFERQSQARLAALWNVLRQDARVERRIKY